MLRVCAAGVSRGLSCWGERAMRTQMHAFHIAFQILLAAVLGSPSAQAQTITGSATLALKSGETTEVGNVYWVSHCRSLLRTTPEVEILEGPPGVTAAIKQNMVIPRVGNCANKVLGGTLVVTANDIEDASYSRLVLRITYKTKDGDRKFSQVYNLSLIP